MRDVLETLRYYARRMGSYHIDTYAASASFFITVAVFPLMMLVLSIVSLTPWSPEDMLEMIALMLPDSFAPLLTRLAEELLDSSATALSLSVSLVVVIWTAARSMLGLLDGLNAIADVNDTRNFLFKRVLCVGYMLLLIAVLVVNLGLRVFGQHILSFLRSFLPGVAEKFSAAMGQRGLTLFLIMTLVFMMIYTAFPNKKLRFLMQLPGAAFTSLAWMGFSALFSLYVSAVGRFSALYGGLTMLILAMFWLYSCMYIVFIGAVINKACPELFWKTYVAVRRRRGRKKTPEN